MNGRSNHHIQCNVKDCKNHSDRENYCTLDCVCIGGGCGEPAFYSSIDCRSYVSTDVWPPTQLNCGERGPLRR